MKDKQEALGRLKADCTGKIDELIKGHKNTVSGLENRLRNWKIGAGVAGGLGALGAGYGIYKGTRDRD